ncbi:MAG: hypothetical protein WC470_02705 [Candidatus Paceibacterota bacterium]
MNNPKNIDPTKISINKPAQKAQNIPNNFCDSSNTQTSKAITMEKFI